MIATQSYVTDEFVHEVFSAQYARDLNSERFAALSPDEQQSLIESAKAKTREWLESTERRILERDLNLALNGTFHPSNTHSRRLFHAVTGISLPNGAGDTRKVITAWAGEDRIKAYYEASEAAAKAEQAAKQTAAEAKRNAVLDEAKAAIRNDERIHGDTLVDVARSLGINVHPRTVSMLRKRVTAINSSRANVVPGGKIYTAFDLYKQCRELLLAE